MSKRDYYEVLGVDRQADAEAIKKAFRKKAGEFHPDRHPGLEGAAHKDMEDRFKEVGEAYAVLSDAEKRARYDRFGHQEGGNPFGGGGNPFEGAGFEGFGDAFGDLFQGFFGGGGGRQRKGQDLKAELELKFEEAVFGKEAEMVIPSLRACATCEGSGSKPGSKPVTCRRCGGQGQVRVNQGFFQMAAPCPDCRGRGVQIKDPCPDCRGDGRVQVRRTVKVSVPAGVEEGMQVRLRGEGEGGPQGLPAGDLYVVLRIRAHQHFEREGDDLHVELPVSFAQAALGAELEVALLDVGEHADLKVPAGTQPGKILRVRGKGVPKLQREGRGDLLVHVTVEVPAKLSARQKELLEAFALESGESRSGKKGVLDKAKKLFGQD
jgi:molecular chaperone DnaJ